MAELIVALDLPSGREALGLAARLPGLRWAKIGPVLYTREGPAVVREFVAPGVRGVSGLEWHDIPLARGGAAGAGSRRARRARAGRPRPARRRRRRRRERRPRRRHHPDLARHSGGGA